MRRALVFGRRPAVPVAASAALQRARCALAGARCACVSRARLPQRIIESRPVALTA
jgi:hypothetical protein